MGAPVWRAGPADVPIGRFPTMDEVSHVLESLEGYTCSIHGSDEDFHGNVESVETIDFVGGHPDPDLDAVLGGPRTAPKECASMQTLTNRTGSSFLSFHGDEKLVVRIAQELTASCGPLVVYVTDNPVPVFLLSKMEQPIWKEAWF